MLVLLLPLLLFLFTITCKMSLSWRLQCLGDWRLQWMGGLKLQWLDGLRCNGGNGCNACSNLVVGGCSGLVAWGASVVSRLLRSRPDSTRSEDLYYPPSCLYFLLVPFHPLSSTFPFCMWFVKPKRELWVILQFSFRIAELFPWIEGS